MWLMLHHDKPDDYVIATGEAHTVKEFAEIAFSHVGLDYRDYLISDERFFRPAEVHLLKGDYSKGEKKLGWKPKVRFKKLVQMMVDADIDALKR